ncbi:MAG: cell envelope integrity protein CreD [Hyphomicrobiales bacterium]|nr:cell envelope integrity protein CreD [Hyphomicrobiales bacterium]
MANEHDDDHPGQGSRDDPGKVDGDDSGQPGDAATIARRRMMARRRESAAKLEKAGSAFGRFLRSPAAKFFTIALLVFLLLIPLGLVWDLVTEREHRAAEVRTEITSGWGGRQDLRGPALVVPYVVQRTEKVGYRLVTEEHQRTAVFLPERLDIAGTVASEVLHRSIYEATVYRADLKIAGRFAAIDVDSLDEEVVRVDWANAVVAVGLSEVTSLKNSVVLKIDGAEHPFDPGIGIVVSKKAERPAASGIHARPFSAAADAPALNSASGHRRDGFSFEIALTFTGADNMTFVPAGRATEIALTSDWPHPGFFGAFLPERREIGAAGFSAAWRVPHLARAIPQAFNIDGGVFDRFGGTAFGVSFLVPVDTYNLVDRALKYGVMFIMAAFGAAFLLELTSAARIHAVQYILVGIAMILFYVMLLSIAEHAGFRIAYAVAAGLTGLMLSVYVGRVLKSAVRGLVMFAAFAVLYGLLFVILRMEDYALLTGSLAAFAMLTLGMFATLGVNWSGKPRTVVTAEATS